MTIIGQALIAVLPETRGFASALNSEMSKVTKGIEGSLVSVGKTLTTAVTLPIVGFGAAGIKAAADVDKGLREVNTLFGLTGEAATKSFAEIQSGVAGLSREIGIAQTTLTQGLYQAISAGVPRENAFDFLQVASKAAVAGVTDVETSVDGLTSIINAFGLSFTDAQAVADSMFTTVKQGKCVVGSTRVLLADGMYRRIDELVGDHDVVSYDGRGWVRMAAAWIDQGVKETVRLRTRLGREIATTWNHPYLTERGWRKVSELVVGDRVAVPTSLPFFGGCTVGDHQAGLLGLWLAEGAVAPSSPKITTTRYGEDVETWAKAWGCEAHNVERRDGKAATWQITAGRRGHAGVNPVLDWLRRLGLGEVTSATKHVPAEVFTWDRQSLATFLRWLFNGDGWLVDMRPRGRSGFEVGFASKSERLVRDVSHLLLRFGIVGSIRHRDNCWVWQARRYAEVRRFVEHVGIDRPAADLVHAHRPVKQRREVENVEYDPIVAIEAGPAEHVYDLCVPVLHNFIAEDIVAHNTNFEQLSSSIFQIAPAAAAAGVNFREVNAAIATLTSSGVPASVATTQLRAALVGLQRPSEDMNKIFGKLGFANAQAAIEAKGLGFALDAVAKAAGGDTGKLQTLLGSVEAVSAANILAGTSAEQFRTNLEGQANSAGAVNTAFSEMERSTARKLDRLKVTVQNLAITLGEALLPVVEKVAAFVSELATRFQGLSPEMQKVVGIALGVAAALGPVLIISAKLIKAGREVGSAMASAGRGLGLLRNAEGARGGLAKLGPAFAKVGRAAGGIGSAVGSAATAVVKASARIVAAAARQAAAYTATAARAVASFVATSAAAVASAAAVVAAWIAAAAPFIALGVAVGAVVLLIVKHWDKVKAVTLAVWNGIKDFFVAYWPLILGIFTGGIGLVIGLIVKNWDTVKSVTSSVWNAILGVIQAVWAAITGAISAAIGAVSSVISTVLGAISAAWSTAWNALSGIVTGAFGAVARGVSTGISTVLGFVRELPGKITGALGNLAGDLLQLGKNAFESLKRGIESIIPKITKMAGDLAKSLISKLNPANWFSTPEEHYRELWGAAFDSIGEEARRRVPRLDSTVAALSAAGSPSVAASATPGAAAGGNGVSATPIVLHTTVVLPSGTAVAEAWSDPIADALHRRESTLRGGG